MDTQQRRTLGASESDCSGTASTWVVGFDGSDGSLAALRWASEIAARRDERAVVVTAWQLPVLLRSMAGRRMVDVDRDAIADGAVAEALQATALLERSDVFDSPVVIEDHPGSALSSIASGEAPVVVGRRGVAALRHRLLGSVSHYLATHADGPVVVVPEDWGAAPLERIVVGFDGSDEAAAALQWALAVAPAGATVEALVAIDIMPWLSPEATLEQHPDAVMAARERIAGVLKSVDPDELATWTFVNDGARQAFRDVVGRAELVVVGPRGLGGVGRALLGSLTLWLLHDAQCPVAVVPSP